MKTSTTYGIPYQGAKKAQKRADLIKKFNRHVRALESKVREFDVDAYFREENLSTVFGITVIALSVVYFGGSLVIYLLR